MSRVAAVWARVRATRRADRAGIAVVAVLVAVSAGFVVAARIHPAATDSRAELDEVHERLDAADPWEPRVKAADDGTVRVLEQGFVRDDGPRGGYAIGFVLENTSRVDAVQPEIELRVFDAEGDEVVDADVDGGLENGLLPPGGRIGVADTVYLLEPVAERMTLTVGESQWYPARPGIGEVTATALTAEGETGLRATIDSSYDTALLAPVFHVLFRDASGTLLGGRIATSKDPRDAVPPGVSRHDLELPAPPPKDADPEATALYVGHDPTIVAF